jgi:hypothetical protein
MQLRVAMNDIDGSDRQGATADARLAAIVDSSLTPSSART